MKIIKFIIKKYNWLDVLLIDIGDLTREINIMYILFAQRGIVKITKENNIPCYVATYVLVSLIRVNFQI